MKSLHLGVFLGFDHDEFEFSLILMTNTPQGVDEHAIDLVTEGIQTLSEGNFKVEKRSG